MFTNKEQLFYFVFTLYFTSLCSNALRSSKVSQSTFTFWNGRTYIANFLPSSTFSWMCFNVCLSKFPTAEFSNKNFFCYECFLASTLVVQVFVEKYSGFYYSCSWKLKKYTLVGTYNPIKPPKKLQWYKLYFVSDFKLNLHWK